LTNGLTTNQAWLDCLQAVSAHYTREILINSHTPFARKRESGNTLISGLRNQVLYPLHLRRRPGGMTN
jgi:hypothetical protein